MTVCRWFGAALAVVLVAGCGDGAEGGAASGGPKDQRDQANRVLARWDEAVEAAGPRFVPVGDLTSQIGTWEEAVGDNNKRALMAGRVVASGALASIRLPDSDVTWAGGARLPVTVLSAREAIDQLAGSVESTDCSGCSPLTVTGAELVRASVQTSRGPAQAPAWSFTLRGSTVRITRIAVGPAQIAAVTPPPWNLDAAPAGLSIEGASLASDGITLTAAFTGSPGPASKPCGTDYAATAVESETAVVVLITATPYSEGMTCPAIGAQRTATTRLSRPLADRTVLEIREGLPVPLTRAP